MAGNEHRSISLRVLLLALLLAVQALGHAHATEHELDGDNTLCSVCSVTGHGKGAIVDSCDAADASSLPQPAPAFIEHTFPVFQAHRPAARAPPSLLID